MSWTTQSNRTVIALENMWSCVRNAEERRDLARSRRALIAESVRAEFNRSGRDTRGSISAVIDKRVSEDPHYKNLTNENRWYLDQAIMYGIAALAGHINEDQEVNEIDD